MRIIFILFSFFVGGLGAYFGQPLVHGNAEAVTIIVTVITVFAGFLIAIITIVGDPAMIPGSSWRHGEIRRDSVEAKLIQHLWLFIFYLITIGLLFVGVLFNKAPDTAVSIQWKVWIERLYLFFGISSFFLTFGLPRALLNMQLARLDAEVERRRRDAGIKDPP